MRIALLGHREIASNLALSLLASGLSGHEVGIFLSGSAASETPGEGALDELERLEDVLCDGLEAGELWQHTGVQGFETMARLCGRPITLLPAPNAPAGLAALSRFAPDLIVSVRYRKILKAAAIAIPRLGVINLHSGLLPEYQGAMATFWSMLAGERDMGWTLHHIVDGTIDTGPIIERQRLPIDYGASYLRNVLALYPGACERVLAAVQSIERDGDVASAPQSGRSQYYSFPSEQDMRRFVAAGHRLYDPAEVADFDPSRR